MAAYIGYIGLGMLVGILLIITLGGWLGGQFTTLVGSLLLYSAAVFAHFRFSHGISHWPALEKSDTGKTIIWAIGMVFVGYLVITYVGGAWAQNFQDLNDSWHLRPEAHYQATSVHLTGIAALVIIGIDGCILAPVAEEIIFRSGLYRILKGRLSVTAAATVSSLIFSLSHRSVVASVSIFLLGYICCWLYEQTADIRGPIIFHAGYNLLVYLPLLLGKL